MSIVAILQARITSSRLPGKVLKPILGRPMLALQIERILRAKTIDTLVVATSTESDDDPIATMCEAEGVACARGSLDDVLARYYQAGLSLGKPPTHVVRLTGDCPLIDWTVIDRVVKLHLSGGTDYTSNILPPTFPDGLDVEAATWKALTEAYEKAVLPSEREHVMPYLRTPERFNIGNLENDKDLSAHRWTVDEPSDYEKIRAIYERLYPDSPTFTTADILAFLDGNERLSGMNAHIERNEGARENKIR